ncbi:MAG TPA: tetratricopeptide repeat protein [Candidatus Deferrimicrobiaceae bacterium]
MKYRIARSLDSDLSPARDNLGILLAIRGDFPGAVAGSLRAVELEPRNAAVRRNLASTDYASGNIERAIREFRKTVELAPGNLRARAELAMSYIALGRLGEAVGELENAKAHGVRIETRLLEALGRSIPPAHPESGPGISSGRARFDLVREDLRPGNARGDAIRAGKRGQCLLEIDIEIR